MMFRKLSSAVYASPQIGLEEVEEARAMGIAMIVNNRPEGESDDQIEGDRIAAAVAAAGLAYVAIPITHAGFAEHQVTAMAEALAQANGPVLAYCRSGTRSTLLWGLAQAKAGADPEQLAQAAAEAGYDLSPIRQVMDMLAASAR
jgi:uncharacterized protein (TIGR01244 family)